MPTRNFCLFFLILSSFLIPSCSKNFDPEKLKIAVIPKATTGAFWQAVYRGSQKAAEELGVEMLWVGTEREDQRAAQISIVDAQVVNQVDGIVLAPLDGEALLKPVKAAAAKKIPVVIMDSALAGGESYYRSFVATDNQEGGRIAGKALADLLGGKGRVALLRHMEGSASTGKREQGFLEALKKYPQIQVLSSEQYGGRDPQKASENLLLRFTQKEQLELDGIFCPNLTTTYGMLQALRRARRTGQVKLIGFDSDKSLLQALKRGEIQGLIIQDPFKIGYLGVKNIVQHLKGQEIEKRTDTGVVLVTADKLQDPRYKDMLSSTVN